jgi:hypothetical protein
MPLAFAGLYLCAIRSDLSGKRFLDGLLHGPGSFDTRKKDVVRARFI